MFIGHFAVGFAAKRIAPRTSLGTLFLAAQFVDLLWPTLLLLGVERVRIEPGITVVTPLDFVHYPISHSLLTVIGWGMLLGLVHFVRLRDIRTAAVLGGLVVSHWFLDLVVHRPDLPLHPGNSPVLGLGLWDSLTATLAVEGSLFAAGLLVYAHCTAGRDAVGRWGLWALAVFLALVYVGNVLGDAPPGARAIAWAGQAQWLLVGSAYWIDAHRRWLRDPATVRPVTAA